MTIPIDTVRVSPSPLGHQYKPAPEVGESSSGDKPFRGSVRTGCNMLRESLTVEPTNPDPVSDREAWLRTVEVILLGEWRAAMKDGRFSDDKDAEAALGIVRSMILRERMRH